jgi:hypothetical protein
LHLCMNAALRVNESHTCSIRSQKIRTLLINTIWVEGLETEL